MGSLDWLGAAALCDVMERTEQEMHNVIEGCVLILRAMSVERPEIPHQNARVSEAAFRECARRALSSACTLMSLFDFGNKGDIEDMFFSCVSWADENASQMEKQALSLEEEGWLNA